MAERPARTRAFSGRLIWIRATSIVLGCLAMASVAATASELRESPIVKAVKAVSPSIVNIRGEKTLSVASQSGTADSARRVNGMGTGVVVDSRGYILTNYHVVDGVREIQVTLAGQSKHVAKLVARDMETDLALIKIDARERLPVITIGTSSDLMPGESVVAVGNAYGYEHTVTRGIVSALHRAVQVSDAQFYDDLIQTDASINPGNSGGPLLNIDGEMIGINVAVRAGAQGIGFAIPVDKVMTVAAELIANCNNRRAAHGVTLAAVRGEKAVKIAMVDVDSPAAEAGLEAGDALQSIGDIPIRRPLDFQRALIDKRPGEQLKVTVTRDGEKHTLPLTLAESQRETKSGDSQAAWEALGLQLKAMPDEDFKQTYQTQYRGGLQVTAVRPDSPAAAQGIRRGDVLVGMHVWETISMDNVTYILSRTEFLESSPLKFYILRGSETLYGYIALGPQKTRQE